jgi:hypothetical protein
LPREVDDKKTRRALRRLARAKAKAESGGEDAKLSEWEDEFVASVEDRLNTFGSAFNDPEKGRLDDALSGRQSVKLREIEKKASGKTRKPMARGSGFKQKPGSSFKRSSFKAKSGPSGPRVRDIHDDLPEDEDPPPSAPEIPRPAHKPRLRVVKGGKDDE